MVIQRYPIRLYKILRDNPAWLRALCFVAASSSLTLAPNLLGMFLWPEGLNSNAANFFWPVSGLNLALCLKWGWRYSFLILFNALTMKFYFGQSTLFSVIGASLNVMETLMGYGLLRSYTQKVVGTQKLKFMLRFFATSILMGLATGLPLASFLVKEGTVPSFLFLQTALSIAFANACGVLFITPLVFPFAKTENREGNTQRSFLVGGLIVVGASLFAFSEIFEARFNYAFVVFPVLMFLTVRFSIKQMCGYLLLVGLSVYVALIVNAASIPLDRTPEILWFIQAFSWVLVATTLVLSILIAEKRNHEMTLLGNEKDFLELQLRENKAQLSALRYQIDPHFLFNSLNSISSVVEEEPVKAQTMLTQLATFFRTTLDTPIGELITLQEAIDEVMLYLKIEKNRYEESLLIETELDSELAEQKIPAFLLQPLVENAIRHGSTQTKGVFKITLRSRVDSASFFLLEIQHSGTWKEGGSDSGIGLENIRQRLRLHYADLASLETILEKDQVCQRLRFPFIERDAEG